MTDSSHVRNFRAPFALGTRGTADFRHPIHLHPLASAADAVSAADCCVAILNVQKVPETDHGLPG